MSGGGGLRHDEILFGGIVGATGTFDAGECPYTLPRVEFDKSNDAE